LSPVNFTIQRTLSGAGVLSAMGEADA